MENPLGRGFLPVSDKIATRKDITPAAKLVHAVLSRLQSGKAMSYPSYDAIARMAGISRSQAIRAVNQLEALNLVEVRVARSGPKKLDMDGRTAVRYTTNLFMIRSGQEPVRKRRASRKLQLAQSQDDTQ